MAMYLKKSQGASGVVEEPPAGGANSGGTDVDTDGHVPEEQPGGDQSLVGATGRLVHDVEIRGVEGEGSGGQTVSDQVDPEQLDGGQGLRQAKGSGKEDADNLTNIGGDQVADELLHVGIDSTALLNGSDNGGEVVVSKNHLRGRLGDSGSTTHGNTDLSLLQGRGVVDTVSSHGGDLVHSLQVLDNLGLVERLHPGEHARVLAAHLLLGGGEIVKLSAREGVALGPLLLGEDADPPADGGGGVLVVSGDHDDTDASLLAELDGGSNLHPWRVKHADDTDEGKVDLVLGELGGVVEVPVLGVRGGVTGGEGKASEGVAASSVLDGALHNLGPQLLSHGHLLAADPDVGATVKDSLRGSLHEHLGSVSDPSGLLGGAVAGHALPVPGELKSEVLLPLAVHVFLHNLGLLEASSGLGDSVGVDLLSQGNQGSLSGLSNLLKNLLELVEVNGRVVAHHGDGGHLLQGLEVSTLDLLSVVEDIANRLVGGPS